MTLCPKCETELKVGDWPFCPHGRGASGAIGDDIPGGMVMEHVEPGRKVYSKSELKRVLAAKGWKLTESGRHDGRCKDKHMPRWV